MDVTKKTYEAPEIEVVEIEQADIIATSTQADVTINNGSGYILGEETW